MSDNAGLILEVKASYAAHPGYRHPFWQWISDGAFDLEALQRFALIYYEHVKVFRLYLAGAMTIMPTELLQVTLARILTDEFWLATQATGQPASSHPELYRDFMRSIGLTAKDWNDSHMIAGIRNFQDTHYALFRGGLVDETLGAIVFGCEMSTPYRHSRVSSGLKSFSTTSGREVDQRFFSEHVEIDPAHSEALIDALLEVNPPVSLERLIYGARISFDARKMFLDDLALHLGLELSELA